MKVQVHDFDLKAKGMSPDGADKKLWTNIYHHTKYKLNL